MLLQEAVDNFAYRLNKSTDIVAKEKIEHDILTAYSVIVERKLAKKSLVGTSLIDSILVGMIEVDDPVLPKSDLYSEDQKMKVSTVEIPRALATPNQDCAYLVTGKSGESSFTFIRPDRIKHRNTRVSKFIAENPPSYYTLLGRKIYSYDLPDIIRVTAIFANPKEIAEYKRGTNKSETLVVHIDNDIFNGIKALLINEYPEYMPLKKEARELETITEDAQPR